VIFYRFGSLSARLLNIQRKWPEQQGCQMVYFQTQNPNFGKFWSALPRMEIVDIYFIAIWNILLTFYVIL
jgi:hypothetical protein